MFTDNHSLNRNSWLIFILGTLAFTIGLNPEFIAFETRFALFAQEMFRQGITFFPMTYQGPYPDYPALPTIFIYGTSLLFGQVTPLSAILPTALTSAGILVLIYRLGARFSPSLGFYSVCFALLTQIFIDKSRTISPDQYVSLITTGVFYLAYTTHRNHPAKSLLWIPPLLILGFALRGPIGLVMPAAVLCCFYLFHQQFKRCFCFGTLSFTLFLLCSGLLLAAAYHQGGHTFIKQVVDFEALGRMTSSQANSHFFYYWHTSLANYALAYPIALLVILSLIKKITRPISGQEKLLRDCVVWFLIIMLGMSIPGAKKARYILPILPPITLIAAYIFIASEKFLQTIKLILITCFYLFPLLSCFIITAGLFLFCLRHMPIYSSAIIGTALLSVSSLFILLSTQPFIQKEKQITLIAVLTLLFLNIAVLTPISYQLEKTKPFVQAVLALQQKAPAPLIFYKVGPDAEDIKFAVNADQSIRPLFIQTDQALWHYPKPAYFITTLDVYRSLENNPSVTLIMQGKIGHRPCVVFRLTKKT
ncbi:MAG: hypothetical protein A2103_00220 [Gammaproteobacteria bacterium GWF2_41_13]|nr:MAG: hypothetical protein A2103_00220 [Gammaproteobacteria bacterium GWF2_41_13]